MARLLVVDDDLVQRVLIGKIGAKLGYETVVASSYEAATELLGSIESSSRDTVAELQGLLGLLRQEGDEADGTDRILPFVQYDPRSAPEAARRFAAAIDAGASGVVRIVEPDDGGALQDLAGQAFQFQAETALAGQNLRMFTAPSEQRRGLVDRVAGRAVDQRILAAAGIEEGQGEMEDRLLRAG